MKCNYVFIGLDGIQILANGSGIPIEFSFDHSQIFVKANSVSRQGHSQSRYLEKLGQILFPEVDELNFE
jgi:hypothetical protein